MSLPSIAHANDVKLQWIHDSNKGDHYVLIQLHKPRPVQIFPNALPTTIGNWAFPNIPTLIDQLSVNSGNSNTPAQCGEYIEPYAFIVTQPTQGEADLEYSASHDSSGNNICTLSLYYTWYAPIANGATSPYVAQDS